MCSRNRRWVNIAGTGNTWLSFPGEEEHKEKTQSMRQRRQVVTKADLEPALQKPNLFPLHTLGTHRWCTLVMLLLVLHLHLQGGQGGQRAPTISCHVFNYWGGRYLHIRSVFACVGMFSPVTHHDSLVPRRGEDQVCQQASLEVKGCKPAGNC